jgi:hypothetical protein
MSSSNIQQQSKQQIIPQYSWARGELYQTCCSAYAKFEMQNTAFAKPIVITVKSIDTNNVVTKIKR